MSKFLRKGFSEHRRVAELKRDLRATAGVVGEVFGRTSDREYVLLLLLTPVMQVAWADGRITARETEAVLEIAELYGIAGDEDTYCHLLKRLLERPSDTEWARNWLRINQILTSLEGAELEVVCNALLTQARFVAEQSSNNLIGFLRGDGLNSDEEKMLCTVGRELIKVRRGQDGGRAGAQSRFEGGDRLRRFPKRSKRAVVRSTV